MSADTIFVAVKVMGPIKPVDVGVPLRVFPFRVSHVGFPETVNRGAGVPVDIIL